MGNRKEERPPTPDGQPLRQNRNTSDDSSVPPGGSRDNPDDSSLSQELTIAEALALGEVEYELYDLLNDPHELNNLADRPDQKKIFEQLLSALNDWSERTDDFMPSKRTSDEFDRVTGEPDHSVRVRPRPSKLVYVSPPP